MYVWYAIQANTAILICIENVCMIYAHRTHSIFPHSHTYINTPANWTHNPTNRKCMNELFYLLPNIHRYISVLSFQIYAKFSATKHICPIVNKNILLEFMYIAKRRKKRKIAKARGKNGKTKCVCVCVVERSEFFLYRLVFLFVLILIPIFICCWPNDKDGIIWEIRRQNELSIDGFVYTYIC